MRFEVWMEGHVVQGNDAQASLIAVLDATDFAAAQNEAVRLHKAEHPADAHYWAQQKDGAWTHYGCRLFPAEDAARKSFG